MKREVWEHPKTYDLAARLDIPTEYAAGLLGKLWNWCADVAPAGDIGKWTDGAIARALNWRGDATEFVQAFVDARWLDRDETHRLLVHDLSDHAPNWWKAKLTNLKLDFAKPTTSDSLQTPTDALNPTSTRPCDGVKPTSTAHYSGQVRSGQVSSSLVRSGQEGAADQRCSDGGEEISRDAVCEVAAELFTQAKYAGDDGQIFWQAAAILEAFPGHLTRAQLVGAASASKGKRKPPGYFREVVREACSQFDQLVKQIKLSTEWPTGPPGKMGPRQRSELTLRRPPPPDRNPNRDSVLAQIEALERMEGSNA